MRARRSSPLSPTPTADISEILFFCLLAYGLSWAVWVPMVLRGTIVSPGGWPTHFGGLVGPALAGLLTLAVLPRRRAALGDLARRMVRVRFGWGGWALALAPGVLLLAAVAASQGLDIPVSPDGARRYSGLPELSVPVLFVIVFLINGLGEEGGWRGFLLPRLQRRFGAVAGTLVLAAVWIGWHTPLFWLVATYRGMGPAMLVFGFGLGITCGAFVLAQVASAARGSVVAPALWHSLYNMATATAIGGLTQAGVSAVVMAWGIGLFAWALADARGRTAITVPAPPMRD